ncbi:hypothetical protein NPS01_15190 [Nocardioides psychrotolerans]|uniref:Lysyl oxidase n=1 Tax=Nocardioides psychrotolerans TaxID=1005945 RepID=A0A1I3F4H2_9ACTN|nr:lysyl oxidase family protein [Nocardioides psychrotolerans]GEP37856.1 hypothetical protein NPS01_15190 [Nocardioides psychrotolerans]SFI06050.1 Lysyl oxidase [Nocardioides psychrotolerans]
MPRTSPRSSPGTALRTAGLAVLALTLPALPALTSGAADAAPTAQAASQRTAGDAPVTLWSPDRIEAPSYGGRVYTDLGLRLVARDQPFELWSTRTGYDQEIRTVWRSGTGDVALPAGSMSTFSGLRHFLKLSFDPVKTGPTTTMVQGGCLSGFAERVSPDAPATSDYPRSCYYNPYAIGSVQGVQAGWATPVFNTYKPLRLVPGRYDVTAAIGAPYTKAFGLSAAEASRTFTLVVTKEDYSNERRRTTERGVAAPAGHEPTQAADGEIAATRPDLRSLPAWGIQVSPNGTFLQFSATVWNGGDSPLVVDGFRKEGEDEMEGYQYFFDADGAQTGYQRVGRFHWDEKPTHQHWHFKDFASYTLLNSDKTAIVKSRKESFCLANTDAVDTTVPSAVWNPENTDLSTACGDYGSLSIREVLASGWGDTYAQFRAGQSFNLDGLPNGTYYIEVKANPRGKLVEASTDNNVALRRIVIAGLPDARTVKVPQIGLVVEPRQGGRGGF